MNENTDFKFGIFSWFGWVMPLPERLQLIKSCGFDAVSIWWEDEIGEPGFDRRDMPGMVQDTGLILENVHVPYDRADSFWSESRMQRNAVVSRHFAWLDECASCQVPLMVMHIIDKGYPPQPNKWGVESLNRIVNKAEQLGIKIAIENTGCVKYIDFILREIDSDYLGLCYDSSHDRLYSKEMGIILQQQGNRLFATHFSDNDGCIDRHWLPGEGIIDWQQLGSYFPAQLYKGCLSLEVQAKPGDLNNTAKGFLSKAYHRSLQLRQVLCPGR